MTPQGRQPPPHLPLKPAGGLPDGSARARDIDAVPARDWDRATSFWPNDQQRGWPPRSRPGGSSFRPSGPNGIGRRSPSPPPPPRRDFDRERERDRERDHPRERERERERDPHHPRERERERGERGERGDHGISREWAQYDREREARVREQDRREQDRREPRRSRALERADRAFDPRERDREREERERRFRDTDRYRGDDRPLTAPRSPPRSHSRPLSPPPRRRRDDRPLPGPGPSTMAQRSPSVRSVSPDNKAPSPAGGELEEGEVVSPVRPTRWNGDREPRDRSRRWPSPGPGRERDRDRDRDRDIRDREREPRDRDRDRDRGGAWQWRRSRPNSRQRSPASPAGQSFIRPSDDGWATRRRAATSPAQSWRSGSRPRSPQSRDRSPDEREAKPDIERRESEEDRRRSDDEPRKEREPSPTPAPVVEAKVDVVVPSMAHDEAAAREPTPTPTSTSASDRAGDAAHNESIHAASEFEPGQVTSAVAETEVMSESPLAEEPASSAQDAAKSPSPAVKPAVNLTSFEPPEEVAQPAASSVEPVIKAEPEPEPLAQVDGTTHVSPPSPIAQVPEQVESAQEEADVEDPAAEVVIANLATEVKERSPQPEEPVRPEATEPHAPPPPVKVLRRDTPPTEPIAAELVIQEPSTSDPVIDAHDVPEAVAETLPAPTNESPADVKMASVPTTPRSVPPLQAPPPDVDIEMTDLAQPTGSEESSVAPAEVKPPVEPVAAEYEAAQVEDASIEPKPKDFAYAEAEPELTVTTATEVLADISVEMEPAEVVAVLTENAPMEPLVEAAATLTAEGVVDKVICAADPEPVMVKAQTPEPTESFVQAVPEPLTLKAQVESEPPTDDVEMTDVNSTPLAEAEAAEVIEKTVTFLSPERGNVSLARTTRSTIADRRLVDLPDREPLPRSSKDRLRDPNPTVESVQASTDAETEVDDEEEPMDPYELLLREKVMAAMAVLPLDVDVDAIIKWNRECAPTESSRVPEDPNFIVDEMIKDVIRPLKEEQKRVVPHVAVIVGHEKAELDAKVEYLREDYLEKDREWHEHCERLDRLMEKRGPPPADLYAIPGSILPPATPGLPPTTPIVEETFPSRSNRRRGAGDAVATEAEYQAILAGLADSAAKDPTHRATKTAATIPDMILTKERDFVYDDENYRVDDPLKFYDFAGVAEQIWTDEERTKFLKRYLQYPKQFGKIAEGLPDKTAGDCVLYYYRTKYAKDYKTTLASRRGVKARRAVAKKKSSALMADIERQKQTTGGGKSKREREREARAEREREKTDGGSATGTPQPNGRKPRARVADTPSVAGEETPGPPSRKRKPEDKTDNEESATPSRATSEAPSNVSKKQRIPKSGGKKRPRPSSFKEEKEPAPGPAVSAMTSATPTTPAPVASDLSQQATLDHAAAVAIASMNGAPPPPAPDSVAESPGPLILDPTTQLPIDTGPLLPPVKRAKRRKQNHPPLDEAEVAVAEAASTPKPRRSGTNSYWSVAEKTKFPELVREHGTDFRAIADKLGGTKTVVQVRNHYNLTIDELRGKGIVQPQTNEVGVRDVKVNGAADAYGGFPPLRPGHEYSPPGARRTSHEFPEPRMAVFPPSPHQHTVPPPLAAAGVLSTSATPSAPPSRSGGMRISALLNDDPPKERAFDTASIASDGTVDERDFGNEGTPLRPSPRPPPAPAPKPIYHDYDQRASFDERERELERERFEQEHAGFRPASTGYSYAAAAAGTPAWRHDPRDPRGDPRPRDSRDPRDPRDPRADPRAEPRDVRIDPRADPRADPRPDPRMDPRERERLERDRLERERHDHVRLEAARHHELRDHHDPHARDLHARDPRDVRDPRDNRDPRDAHRDPRDYYPSTHHSPPHTHTHAGPGPLPPVSRLSSGPGPLPSLGVFPPSQHSGHSAQIPHHVHHPMAHQGQVHHSREYGRQQSDWRPYLAAPNGERGEYPQR